ncbi:hypothetical protein [Glutamicibacter sp. 0426]|uniref:hypothetical protein n=1 Tax=Glutamicibacter sp. 0426 TaxID=1913445 RepID=UPI001160E63F|nr:hypothetical protein [Glutamicibacter sp. 0426]
MNTQKIVRRYSSAAIAAVPAFVLVALASALIVSVAPAEAESSASSTTGSCTAEATPPSEPEPPDSASLLYEKSDYGRSKLHGASSDFSITKSSIAPPPISRR